MGKVRDNPRTSKQIPRFKARLLANGSSLWRVIICTRCGNSFAVYYPAWLAARPDGVITRSCTYCFKVSRLPKEESDN